jgi:hypothetical protein
LQQLLQLVPGTQIEPSNQQGSTPQAVDALPAQKSYWLQQLLQLVPGLQIDPSDQQGSGSLQLPIPGVYKGA